MSSANSPSFNPRALLNRPTPRISRSPVFGVLPFGDERDFAVVIVEADAREPFVRDALVQFDLAEIAVIDAFLRERLVEFDQQRLVLRLDGADDDGRAVL